MSGPHLGKIPRRVSTLRLARRDHAAFDFIACHADREGRAWLCRETIACEAGIDRSKVSLCVGNRSLGTLRPRRLGRSPACSPQANSLLAFIDADLPSGLVINRMRFMSGKHGRPAQ
jgi:hypothetical protein